MWDTRTMKCEQRKLFFEDIGVAQNYLTLPGINCGDIKIGKKNNILLPGHTHITAVERETKIAKKIYSWLKTEWGEHYVVKNCPLYKVEVNVPQDLVFLDLMGNLTANEARWIKDLPLTPGANLCLTVLRQTRGNQFIPACRDIVKSNSYYYDMACREVRDSGDYPSDLIPSLTLYMLLFRCYLFPHASYRISMNYYGEIGSPSVMLIFKIQDIRPQRCELTRTEAKIEREISSLIENHLHVGEIFNHIFVEREMIKLKGKEVVKAIQEATTRGQKAAATRLLKKYIQKRAGEGLNPVMVEAGIKARLTRLANGK